MYLNMVYSYISTSRVYIFRLYFYGPIDKVKYNMMNKIAGTILKMLMLYTYL